MGAYPIFSLVSQCLWILDQLIIILVMADELLSLSLASQSPQHLLLPSALALRTLPTGEV